MDAATEFRPPWAEKLVQRVTALLLLLLVAVALTLAYRYPYATWATQPIVGSGDSTLNLNIIPVYAAAFAVFFVLLSINVIRARRQHKLGIGTGRIKSVERAMRVHANLAEYVPFASLLITLLEFNKASNLLLIGLCSLLLVGLLVHAFGVSMKNEALYIE